MNNRYRHDNETASIVDRAVELYAGGDQEQAIALLAERKLSDSVVGRVLCDPDRRRAAHVESPPAQP